MGETGRDPLKELEEAWKKWAQRPPETSPEEASRRVLSRLLEPDRVRESSLVSRRWLLLPAAAAVLLVLGLSLLWWPPEPTPKPEPPHAVTSVTLDEDTALIWLDSETPLYMTLAPPRRQ